jgi:predicted CoA-substrate-specific enzyme activase
MYYIGVDIGSTCAKTTVTDAGGEICFQEVCPTGWSSVDTAENIRKQLADAGFDPKDNVVVATGYGRVAIPYSDKTVTEITCHCAGAVQLFGHQEMGVIDIGGQDTKIIEVEHGMVKNFIMNDKCSAGTGRFLEVMANTLSVTPDQLTVLAEGGSDTSISSLCTVFAESEVISLIGRGEKKENIAFAVVDSIVRKVASQASRMHLAGKPVCLTGGLCDSEYIRKALSNELKMDVETCPQARYAGSIGATVFARKLGAKKS